MKIISVCVNNPLFIEMQYNSIQKYFKSDTKYEIIVFNDAKQWPDLTNFEDVTMKQQITNICRKLNIECINIPNLHHMEQKSASLRHSDSVSFMTKYMLDNPDSYLMLDSDMFFVDHFDISEFNNYYFCYVNQTRTVNNLTIHYPWPNFFYLDSTCVPYKELIKWYSIPGCDSGGMASLWLSKLDKEKILKINHLPSCSWNENDLPENINPNLKLFLHNDVRNQNGNYFAELYHDKILHYRAASNWMNESFELHNSMTQLLYEILMKM